LLLTKKKAKFRTICVILFICCGTLHWQQWPILPLFPAGVSKISLSKKSNNQMSKERLLWADGAPGAKSNSDRDKPMLFAHPAPKSNNKGTAIIVCPGGAYAKLSMGYEGHDVAKWFNQHGVSGFVLRSRYSPHRHPIPLNDAKRAMRTVRHFASQYSIDTTRIGILGFSAGGHLASTLLTHFDGGDTSNADPIEHQKSRPDFGVLVYPVITLTGPAGHSRSRGNLLGKSPAAELVEDLSNHLQVTKNTPPTFLAHGDKDRSVPLTNSELFYSALSENDVPAKLHVDKGKGHAYGLKGKWPEVCVEWMTQQNIIPNPTLLSLNKISRNAPSSRPAIQIGISGGSGISTRGSLVYIIYPDRLKQGHLQPKKYLPNGKQVFPGK
jgi:acetyl esterase/lipase